MFNRDLTSILKNGGKRAAVKVVTVDSAGVITASGAFYDMPYRFKSKLSSKTNNEKHFGEAGEYQATEKGNRDFSYVISSSQFDKAFLDTLVDAQPTDRYQLFVEWGKGSSNKIFEAFFALVSFEGDFDIDFPGRKPDITINIHENETVHTPAAVPPWFVGVPANFTTSINRGVAVYET